MRSKLSKTAGLETVERLLPPLSDQQIEADHSVFVTRSDDRVLRVDVVLKLNDLLGSLCQVGDVSNGDVIRHLLLDGEARVGVVVGSAYRRIDLDRTYAK